MKDLEAGGDLVLEEEEEEVVPSFSPPTKTTKTKRRIMSLLYPLVELFNRLCVVFRTLFPHLSHHLPAPTSKESLLPLAAFALVGSLTGCLTPFAVDSADGHHPVFSPALALSFSSLVVLISSLLWARYLDGESIHLLSWDNKHFLLRAFLPACLSFLASLTFYRSNGIIQSPTRMISSLIAATVLGTSSRPPSIKQWLSVVVLIIAYLFLDDSAPIDLDSGLFVAPSTGSELPGVILVFTLSALGGVLSSFGLTFQEYCLRSHPSLSVANAYLYTPLTLISFMAAGFSFVLKPSIPIGLGHPMFWIFVLYYSLLGVSTSFLLRYSGNVSRNLVVTASALLISSIWAQFQILPLLWWVFCLLLWILAIILYYGLSQQHMIIALTLLVGTFGLLTISVPASQLVIDTGYLSFSSPVNVSLPSAYL